MDTVVFTILNGFTFLAYGYDKIMAINSGWRISEKTLLSLSLLGGFGGLLGMCLFRHKTKKTSFKIAVSIGFIISLVIFTYKRGLVIWV